MKKLDDMLNDHAVVCDEKHWRRRQYWKLELSGDGWVTISDHRSCDELQVPLVDLWEAAKWLIQQAGER